MKGEREARRITDNTNDLMDAATGGGLLGGGRRKWEREAFKQPLQIYSRY